MKRRDFLKYSTTLAALSSLSSKSLAQGSQWVHSQLHNDLPITRTDSVNSEDFNGDNVDRPHNAFWDLDGYIKSKGGEPTSFSEDLDVVVVGGGMSGLIAAYYLKDQKFTLLEMDSRLGGNSKGEIYKNSVYSLGAAYIVEPDLDSDLGSMLTDLDVLKDSRQETASETTVLYKNLKYRGFWQGVTDPRAKLQFEKIFSRLNQMMNEEDWEFEGELSKALDKITFEAWLQQEFGDVHPHIKEYFQLYGWSSFCGSIDELSAFQYLSFIAFETDALRTFPGGNSYITQALTQRVRKTSGAHSLRANSTVLRVTSKGDHAEVIYEDAFGVLKKIQTKQVIMACQKFVARRMITNFPKDMDLAVSRLLYRSYLVGNVILNKKIESENFELYCLDGSMPSSPTVSRPGQRSFSDVCFGTWAQHEQVDQSVITLYQGLAYDGARQFLFNPDSHQKYRKTYLNDINPVLQSLNLNENDIAGIRLSRWGHALPIAMKGLISEGTLQCASQSIDGLIHFANQDNWANPCFETAHACALEAVTKVTAS